MSYDMNPVQEASKKVSSVGSPFFPPSDNTAKAKVQQLKDEAVEAIEEEEEPPEPQPCYDSVQSLLMPLRKFSFAEKHTFVSYALADTKPSGSAVKIVDEIKAKVITEIPIKPGIKKSRLQRLLDVFPLEKIAPFLATRDIHALNFASFYFHTRVYDLVEIEYRISVSALCRVSSTRMNGFLENNYIVVDNYQVAGSRLTASGDELILLRDMLLTDSGSSVTCMLKELHIEPNAHIDEVTLFSFYRALGSARVACEYLVHLSLEGAGLGIDGTSPYFDSSRHS